MSDPSSLRLISLLEGVAQKMGIEVRYESLESSQEDIPSSRGGLCRIRDRRLILVEKNLNAVDRASVLAGALRGVDLSKVFIAPLARRAIEEAADE